LVERRVLDWLLTQGQCVPFSHTLDLATDAPALVCQQDLQASAADGLPSTDLQRQVARCLARIHVTNHGRAAELAWLPRANQAYFADVILADFREQLAQARQQPTFLKHCGDVARQMEEAIEPFLTSMGALWAEAEMHTLIHADMMDAHVLVHEGRPYLIDWGQARYGSFYLDLPNYFTPATVQFYREALAELGFTIPEAAFMQRYRAAGRYPGFKYMGFLLHLWTAGQLDTLQGPLMQHLVHGVVGPAAA
jgi:aminoglycoside phosphotransferase (APT) family kinase protein